MPRKESLAVPESNDPILQYVLPGITLEDLRRIVWDEVCEKNEPKSQKNTRR